MMRHWKCHRKTIVVVESDSDSSVVGLDSDENLSEISISDNNFDTEENIEMQFAMPILESVSDVIQSPFTDFY